MQLGGNVRLELRARDRLEQAVVGRPPEVGEIGRDQHVGRRLLAFAAEAFEQLGRGAAPELDVEATDLLEVLEDLLVAVVGTTVVDHDRVALVGRSHHREDDDRRDPEQREQRQRPAAADETGEHDPRFLRTTAVAPDLRAT